MDEFSQILSMEAGPRKTAALVQWVQGLYRREKDRPVLVGGAAVELLTGGAYTTGDLDLVGSVTPTVASALKQSGFTREGRYWFHEEGRVFLEFLSAALGRSEEARERIFGDCSVLIISAEDLLVDRLSVWKRLKSPVDGINAFLLYRAVEAEMDLRRLEGRAVSEDVYFALDSVRKLFLDHGGDIPDDDIVLKWAAPWKGEALL